MLSNECWVLSRWSTINAISRILRYKTLDNVSFGSMLAIADWLDIDNPRELVEVSEADIDNVNDD